MSNAVTFNEATPTCGQYSHHGFEVLLWRTSSPDDVEVLAICRDEATARLLVDAVYAERARLMGDQPLPLDVPA